jgi:hypothetical protein
MIYMVNGEFSHSLPFSAPRLLCMEQPGKRMHAIRMRRTFVNHG